MADSPKLANCKYENFVVNSSQQKKTGAKGRVDLFLDKFYSEDKFLTELGLVSVYYCIITSGKEIYEFDAAFKKEKELFKSLWMSTYDAKGKKVRGVKLNFGVGIKGVVKESKIELTKFKKTNDIFGGSGAAPKVNQGIVFEQQFYEDAIKVLMGKATQSRFQPFIVEFNDMIQKKMKLAISNIEATGSKNQDSKFSGVLDEGSKNQSRPLKISSDGGLIVSAGGETTLDMGSTLTDITFQYGPQKKPVYLSLKFGPTLTFFNYGVGGRNGPTLFTRQEVESYNITTKGGKAFLKMFGIDSAEYMRKFCESFVNYPRSEAIQNHEVDISSTDYDKKAIEALLKSGMGYGYYMIHNTSGNTIDSYEMSKKYMTDASTITGDVKVFFGRMNGKGKGVNITCESKHYNFIFNVRNKQGGLFPTHVMCDYKKKQTPDERSERGNA